MTTLNTLTARQQAQYTFYTQWAPKVAAFGVYNLPEGTLTHYRAGKKIAAQIVEFEAAAARAESRKCRWTAEEYDAMAAAYVKHGRDRKACLAEFRLPSTRHTDDAVTFAAYSAAALDTQDPSTEGFKDYAKGLLNALNALCPGRFKGNR